MRPIALAVLLTTLALAGCEDRKSDLIHGSGSSGTTGTVVDRNSTGKTSWLHVRDDRGVKHKVYVRGRAYRRCHKGESYPACTHR